MARARSTATSRDPEEYQRLTALARETRDRVAEQVRDLIVDGDQMGARGTVTIRVQRVIEAERRGAQAAGQHQQARELGLALAPSVQAMRAARESLRAAVMELAVAAASWAAAMDHDDRLRELGHVRRNGTTEL